MITKILTTFKKREFSDAIKGVAISNIALGGGQAPRREPFLETLCKGYKVYIASKARRD